MIDQLHGWGNKKPRACYVRKDVPQAGLGASHNAGPMKYIPLVGRLGNPLEL